MSEFRFYISFLVLILGFQIWLLFSKFIQVSLNRLPYPWP